MGAIDELLKSTRQEEDKESGVTITSSRTEQPTPRTGGGAIDELLSTTKEKSRTTAPEQVQVQTTTKTEEPTKKGFFAKAVDAGKKVVKYGLDAWNSLQQKNEVSSFQMRELMYGKAEVKVDPATGKKTLTTPKLEAFKSAKTEEERAEILSDAQQDIPLVKFLNLPTTKKVISTVSEKTSNIPLKTLARVQSIGSKTYEEAYNAWLSERNDPANPTWQKFLYELQDTGVQTAIGAILSIGTAAATRNPQAGYVVSGAFYTALSADEQLQERGKVDSVGNIAIDVVGDQMLNGLLTNVLGKSSKTAIVEALKGFGVEGSTEVAQSLLKYANDYGNARTDEEKQKVLDNAKRYVTSGGIAMEFAVGGVAGGIITGATSAIDTLIAGTPSAQPNQPTTRPTGEQAQEQAQTGGAAREPITEPVEAQIENADITDIRNRVAEIERTADLNDSQTSDIIAQMRDILNDYTTAFNDKTIYVPSENTEAPLVEVETSKFPDGKVVVRFTANTETNGISSPYDYTQLFTSQEEATKSARDAIIAWARSQEAANPQEKAQYEKIVDYATNPRSPITEKLPAKESEQGKQFPTIHEGGVIKMVTGEPVRIFDGIETFIHQGDGGWVVSEATTGRFIAESRSKDGAIAKARFAVDDIAEFKKLIEKNKLDTAKVDEAKAQAEKSKKPEKEPQKKGKKQPAKKVSKKTNTPAGALIEQVRPESVKEQDLSDAQLDVAVAATAVLHGGEAALNSPEFKEMTKRGYKLKNENDPSQGFALGKKTVTDDLKAPSGSGLGAPFKRTPDGEIWGALPEKEGAPLPEVMGGIKEINPIELPELVDIARELMGKAPSIVKKTGNAAGRFYADPSNPRIKLIAAEFEQKNLPAAAKTLAHEIGHLIDFLPDRPAKLDRGNLLGRLFTLHNFMAETFSPEKNERFTKEDRAKIRQAVEAEVQKELGFKTRKEALADKKAKRIIKKRYNAAVEIAIDRGGFIKDKVLRNELLAVTRYWHPYDPDKVNSSYKSYRESSVELYAEAISMLFNAPNRLRDMAPTFYNKFFEALDAKPEVRDVYFEIQALLSGDRELILKRRREGIRRMFKDGDYKAIDLHNRRVQERENRRRQYWQHFKHTVIDKNFQIIDRVKKVEREGKRLNPDENPVYFLEERNYIGGKIKAFFEREFNSIYSTLNENEILWEDFGETLFYARIAAGDRSDVANPRGITPDAAKELAAKVAEPYSAKQREILAEQVQKFHAAVRKTSEDAFNAGLYTPELYQQMQENPAYVTFQVLDHLEDGMTSRVYKSLGTLKDIANPADSTMLKVITTIRAAERNKTTKATVDFLLKEFSGEIEEAKYSGSKKGRIPIPSRQPNKELITYFDKGKIKGYYVDPYIAESINNQSVGHNAPIVPAIRFMNSTLFRPLFISFNLGFQSFNLIRDFVRFYKNVPDMTFLRAIKRYGQAGRIARIRAFGLSENPSEKDIEAAKLLNRLEEEKVLSVTFNDLIKGETDVDKQVEKILADTGIKDFQPAPRFERVPKFAKPAVKALDKAGVLDVTSSILGFIENLGNLIETLPKAAGVYEYTAKSEDGWLSKEQKSYIRRKLGSPDFLAGGTYKPITNEVFLFSNAIMQGIRADLEVATDPKTRSGFWWKTTKVVFLPKLLMAAVLMGLLGDEYKELMEGASEYDKTNYTIIPLGRDTNGKPIYLRVPVDETSRFLGGIFWKALTVASNEKSIGADLMDIASYTGGQLPSISPVIQSFSATTQFLAGQNPYDFFRGQNVISDTTFKAGGWDATRSFLGWQFQQLGGGVFYKFYHEPTVPKEQGAAERVFNLPVLGNIIGRFVRISDYGQIEKLRAVEQKVEREKARETLQERDLINKYIEKAREGNIRFNTTSIENELVRERYDGRPKSKTDIEDARRLVKKFRISLKRGEADPTTLSLIDANSNAAKLEIIKTVKPNMTSEEFSTLRRQLIKDGIVSSNVFEQLQIDERKQK